MWVKVRPEEFFIIKKSESNRRIDDRKATMTEAHSGEKHRDSSDQVETICPFCGVGCGVVLRVRDDGEQARVAAVEPQRDHPVSAGQLCAKGWNIPYGIDPSQRITTPLIKEHGEFRPASWSEALGLIGDNFTAALEAGGAGSVGVISSARATNEDNYAAQKFARAVLKTNNIDHCARICHSPSVAGLKQTLGSGAMSNSAADIDLADVLFVIGADPTENHAVLGGRMMRAKLKGAKLIVVDPRRTRLAELADVHLQIKLGSNIALLNGLLHIIFKEGWHNAAFLDRHCDNVALLRRHVQDYPPEKVAHITGVPEQQLREAARIYASAKAAFLAYGMGITQFVSGTNNVIAVSNLVLSCGHIGRPGTGVNPLRGQNNVQGACDMGCLPNVYPGYQDALDKTVQAKFAAGWGTAVPSDPGLTSLGMTGAAREGTFRALLLMGEDPVVTDPDQNNVAKALGAMDFVAVVELNMTDTARCADVVLPAASFAEKDGTFTNCERRVQRVRRALPPPGQARADWQILAAIAEQLGCGQLMHWPDAESVFAEMASLTEAFSGMSYSRLDRYRGLQWPCDAAHPEGTPILHRGGFSIGKAQLLPVHQVDPAEQPDEEYPFYFTTNRLHFHYGCGSMTRKSPLLERETPKGLLFIHPEDARALGLADGAAVRVSSRRGSVDTALSVSDTVQPGLLAMPYHFHEAPSNRLTNTAQDPVTKMPELKACAVRVEALDPAEVASPTAGGHYRRRAQ